VSLLIVIKIVLSSPANQPHCSQQPGKNPELQ
jgi:hypothetical protein